jgi:hypothetical protein
LTGADDDEAAVKEDAGMGRTFEGRRSGRVFDGRGAVRRSSIYRKKGKEERKQRERAR